MSKTIIRKNILFDYWKTIIIIIIICVISFASSSNFKSIPSFPHSDKIIHAFMYLVLTVVIINDFYKKNKGFSDFTFYLICILILIPIFIGGVVEIIQELFILTRSGSWLDWLADMAGVLVGLLLSFIWIKRRNY